VLVPFRHAPCSADSVPVVVEARRAAGFSDLGRQVEVRQPAGRSLHDPTHRLRFVSLPRASCVKDVPAPLKLMTSEIKPFPSC